ncbi:MAG: Na+/H+ antiporter NhaC family protein [Oscillospiraceae bacterium]|nr:Na+/H+ antiporter NhaC family protein [Oscillospiraceae bacterium]
MVGTFWSLVPPLLAIVLALITKEVYTSLFAGVLLGALFASGFNLIGTLDMIVVDGLSASVSDLAGCLCFLVILGIMVTLINKAGGSAAFGRWAEKNIRTRVGAQIATFVLGILIFIDDYFNCLSVGSVMRPVTDRHRISRAKLAYLIDATAAPVCMIAPISSWAAAVSGVAADLDTDITGIQLFIRAIPYNFYSLLSLVFIVAIILMKFDYGPMAVAEENARLNGDLGAARGEDAEAGNSRGRIIDLVLPVLVLITAVFFAMIYVGGYFGEDAWGGTGFAGDLVGAFGNTDAFIALPWGGLIALAFTFLYFLCRRTLNFKEATDCVPQGFKAMVSPILILVLATSLKTMTSSLGAADFVHNMMEGAAAGLYNLLPAVIFVVAIVLSFSTGTSWGTFGILIPIVVAIFPTDNPLLYIGISSCCAGAVCGDHCSPISDTTIMASAGAQTEHVSHVSTQLPYAMTVAAVSFVTYIFAGFVQNAVISLIVGILLTLLVLMIFRNAVRKKAVAK